MNIDGGSDGVLLGELGYQLPSELLSKDLEVIKDLEDRVVAKLKSLGGEMRSKVDGKRRVAKQDIDVRGPYNIALKTLINHHSKITRGEGKRRAAKAMGRGGAGTNGGVPVCSAPGPAHKVLRIT